MNYSELHSDTEEADSLVRPHKKNKRMIIQSDSEQDQFEIAGDDDTDTDSNSVEGVEFQPDNSPNEEMPAEEQNAGIDSLFDDEMELELPTDDASWQMLFEEFAKFTDPDDTVTKVAAEQGDIYEEMFDTYKQVLSNEWIPKTAARQVSCEISELPDLEQVRKEQHLLVFDSVIAENLGEGFHNVIDVMLLGTSQLDIYFILA